MWFLNVPDMPCSLAFVYLLISKWKSRCFVPRAILPRYIIMVFNRQSISMIVEICAL